MSTTPLFQYINLHTVNDDCKLVVAEQSRIPFPIKRMYYIIDMKSGEPRGFHAHRETQQVLFCLKGSVRLVLENAEKRADYILTDPSTGILLDRYVWHEMHDMTEETVLLVVASHEYDENDYIREYEVFKAELR